VPGSNRDVASDAKRVPEGKGGMLARTPPRDVAEA